jgi:hypothetical protein
MPAARSPSGYCYLAAALSLNGDRQKFFFCYYLWTVKQINRERNKSDFKRFEIRLNEWNFPMWRKIENSQLHFGTLAAWSLFQFVIAFWWR